MSTSAPFEVIPAIDVQGGRCVRLYQGDFTRATEYGDDPVQQALAWQAAGATRLHLVDLDGAREGRPVHLHVLREITRQVRVPVQFGGGLRSTESVARAFASGAERVVLGTALLESPRTVRACLQRFGGRLVAALDVRDGRVATRGWLALSEASPLALAGRLAELGFLRVIHTDISRDGALAGPNLAALRDLAAASGLRVIASGGIRSIEDLLAVRACGAEAAIVGRALYTGDLRLEDALRALQSGEPASAG